MHPNKIVTCLFLLFPFLTLSQTNATWKHFSTEDGLTENTVLSMHQDRQGFMWFGTFSGLNKFDGCEFKTYKALSSAKNGLHNDRIEYINDDQFGFVWVRTREGF